MKSTIENIIVVLDQNGSSEDIKRILTNSHVEWNSNNQKMLENTIRLYREYALNEIIATIIVYAYFKRDDAMDYVRKRGLFAYYTDYSVAEYILQKLIIYEDCLNISKDEKLYLHHKYEIRWLREYYSNCDSDIDEIIVNHEKKKKYFRNGDSILESNIVIELLTILELHFRLSKEIRDSKTSTAIELYNEIDFDLPYYYSIEQLAEAISYVISRYCDKYSCEGKHLWIDADVVINNLGLENLIQIAAKKKLIIEWEITVDYYGYDLEKDSCYSYRIIDKNNFEKSIQLGYIKTQFQEQARNYQSFGSSEDGVFLFQIAEELKKHPDLIFELVDTGTEIERYRMLFHQPLLEFLAPNDFDTSLLFMEEYAQIADTSYEMLISSEELLSYQITDYCTVKDIIIFKRFFAFVSFVQQTFLIKSYKKCDS